MRDVRYGPILGLSRFGVREWGCGGGVLLALSLLTALGPWGIAPAWGAVPLLLALAVGAFFRDPKRSIPPGEDLVAPADGKVIAVTREGDPLGEGRTAIGIFLSVLDVHMTRAPCDGTVIGLRHEPGRFRSALKPEAARENERNRIDLETDAGTVSVVQVAGAIARRIVCPLRLADPVARGERIGMIKFGSQTWIWYPGDAFEAAVAVGDRLRGGETLLARRRVAAANAPAVPEGNA